MTPEPAQDAKGGEWDAWVNGVRRENRRLRSEIGRLKSELFSIQRYMEAAVELIDRPDPGARYLREEIFWPVINRCYAAANPLDVTAVAVAGSITVSKQLYDSTDPYK